MNKQQRGELYCHVRSLLNHEDTVDTFLDYIDNNFKKTKDTSSTFSAPEDTKSELKKEWQKDYTK